VVSTPFTPKHQPDREYELCWHEVCTHTTWRVRAKSLVADSPEPQILATLKNLPLGAKLCPACREAQEHPRAGYPRLVLSTFAKRITAIGFGRARKDELKALRFQWGRVEGVWVFLPHGTDPLEASLNRLGEALGCATEVADKRKVPPRPVKDQVHNALAQPTTPALPPSPRVASVSATGPATPRWAIIACPTTGDPATQSAEQQKTNPIFARLDWPPQLGTVRAVSAQCPYPNAAQVLISPSIAQLIELGCAQKDLWALAAGLAEIGIVFSTRGQDFDLGPQFASIRLLDTASVSSSTSAHLTQNLQKETASQSTPGPATTGPSDVPPLEVTQVLTLPAVPILIQQGFTKTDLFRLAADLTPLGMSLRTADGLIDLSKPMAAARSLPRGSGDAVSPISLKPKSKGGRPATARAVQDQVLLLHREGLSAVAIARTLHISDRSVRRLIPKDTDS